MKKRLFFTFIVMGFLVFGTIGVNAASNVRVYRDGVEVDYSRVKDESGVVVMPQIIKDRLMVPIKQTAEIFGINLVWDPNTSTMTLTKDGVVTTHTIYTNILTINGVAKTYDTPSTVIDGRTLMPNIMIADIINCDTSWDNATRSVIMRSRPKALPKPEVLSATAKREVMIGEEMIVTAMTNQYATSVNLLDSTGRVLSSSSQYVTTGDYRSFTLKYKPTAQSMGPIQFKVQAGDSSGYNKEATKAVAVSVNKGISVVSAYAEDTKPYLNENAKITVTATDGVTRVRLTDKSTNNAYEQTVYTVVNANGDKAFTFNIKMTEKGDKTFSIEIGTDTFYIADSQTVSLTVQNERPKDPISVKEVVYDTKTYYQNDTVYVSVRTSLSAVEVEIYDNYTRTTTRYTNYKDSTNYRTFEVSVKLNTTGANSFYATAYDRDGKKSEKSFTINTGTGAYGALIKNVTSTRSGSNTTNADYIFSIITSNDVWYVNIYDYSGNVIGTAYNYSSYGNNQYVWTITVPYYYITSYVSVSATSANYAQPEYYQYVIY